MNLVSRAWTPSGGAFSSYRSQPSVSRVGRYLVAVGGYRWGKLLKMLIRILFLILVSIRSKLTLMMNS